MTRVEMAADIFSTLAHEGQKQEKQEKQEEQVKVLGSGVTCCLILPLNNGLGITLFDGP